jgi:hypothetical protein
MKKSVNAINSKNMVFIQQPHTESTRVLADVYNQEISNHIIILIIALFPRINL